MNLTLSIPLAGRIRYHVFAGFCLWDFMCERLMILRFLAVYRIWTINIHVSGRLVQEVRLNIAYCRFCSIWNGRKQLGLSIEKTALDRGNGTGAVHRDLELLGITGYIPAIRLHFTAWTAISPRGNIFLCYPAFFRRHLRGNTPEYLCMMRKRKIWAEDMISQPIWYLWQQVQILTLLFLY